MQIRLSEIMFIPHILARRFGFFPRTYKSSVRVFVYNPCCKNSGVKEFQTLEGCYFVNVALQYHGDTMALWTRA